MSTDTPTPERVTLTDEERFDLIEQVGEWFPIGEGFANPQAWAIQVADHACEAFAPILAAREQALREEIAGQIETENDSFGVSEDPYGGEYDRGVHEGLTQAARVARGSR